MPGSVDSDRKLLKRLDGTLARMPRAHTIRVSRCASARISDQWPTRQVHLHDWHMVYVRGGKGTYLVGGVEVPLKRGTLIVCTPGIRWQALNDPGEPASVVTARFDVYTTSTGKPSRSKRDACWHALTPRSVEHTQELFTSLYRSWSAGAPDRDGRCHAIVHTLLGMVADELRRRTSGAFDARIERARSHVERHPSDPYTVADLARIAQMSPDYFSRVFASATGISPKQYILRARMVYARTLLEDTGTSVDEVAAQLGYPNERAFGTQFKAVFGLAPTAVRSK